MRPWFATNAVALVAPGRIAPPDRISGLRAMLAGHNTAAGRKAAAELSRFDSRLWLAQLRVATLVVSVSRDTAVPAHHTGILVQVITAARTASIAKAGHPVAKPN